MIGICVPLQECWLQKPWSAIFFCLHGEVFFYSIAMLSARLSGSLVCFLFRFFSGEEWRSLVWVTPRHTFRGLHPLSGFPFRYHIFFRGFFFRYHTCSVVYFRGFPFRYHTIFLSVVFLSVTTYFPWFTAATQLHTGRGLHRSVVPFCYHIFSVVPFCYHIFR
jgi:hypothetical protein